MTLREWVEQVLDHELESARDLVMEIFDSRERPEFWRANKNAPIELTVKVDIRGCRQSYNALDGRSM